MEVLLLRKPYEASFSGNPVAFVFVVTPYTEVEHAQNIGLNVTVEVEDGFESGVFIEARQAVYLPNPKGNIEVDVHTILEAYVTQYIPEVGLSVPVICEGQTRNYRLRYQLIINASLVTDVVTTSVFTVIKGGLAFQEWHPKKFFTEHLAGKPFLRYSSADEKTHADEIKFLNWIYSAGLISQDQKVVATVFYHDGTQSNKEITQTIICRKWQVCITPAGFNQLGLQTLSNKIPLHYELTIVDTLNVLITGPQRFVLDYRNFYNTYTLMYAGSLGNIETIRMRGLVEAQAEYQKTMVDRITPSAYFTGNILQSPSKSVYAPETEKFSGDTGFITKEKLDRLRDVFLSQDCLYEIKNKKLIPVAIDGKTVKLYSNSDKLFSLAIEWRNAFSNEFYAPGNLLGTVNAACPLPAAFEARQVDKNFLQVLWSLEPEYDEVEIEFPGVTGIEITRQIGNTGQAKIFFKNPLIDNPSAEGNITIRARTVCDSNSIPASVSAWMTYMLIIVKTYAPVATDDNLTVARGITTSTLLNGNLLDNDYDPDGDQIRCLAVNNQATTKGGRISITADGRVSYMAPSALFEGEDLYEYEIREVTDPSSFARAMVKITVGSPSSGSVVYVKMVLRNVITKTKYVYGTPPYSSADVTSGEVWFDFFADALGTLPIDITSLSLTLNYEQKVTFFNPTDIQTTNKTVVANGNKVKVFQGDLGVVKIYGTAFVSYKVEFRPLSGVGYAII